MLNHVNPQTCPEMVQNFSYVQLLKLLICKVIFKSVFPWLVKYNGVA